MSSYLLLFLGTHFSTAIAYIQNQVGIIKGNDHKNFHKHPIFENCWHYFYDDCLHRDLFTNVPM